MVEAAEKITKVDILIVGGGLIGMALMHALVPLGVKVHLVESRSQKQTMFPDILETRSIALSPASIRILKQLGVWSFLASSAEEIHTIHISEKSKLGQARLNRTSESEPLGAVAEMHRLEEVLQAQLSSEAISFATRVTELDAKQGLVTLETAHGKQLVQAKWICSADGADSSIRKLIGAEARSKTYPEHAIATNIALSRAHHNVAYERFTSDGPLALLPLSGPHMALVWTLKPSDAERLKNMDESAFLSALQQAFGYRAGRFNAVGPRMTYPLRQVMMPEQVHGRVVFLGNAAHTLHPVAGQGFNLGLRDVAMLAECAAKRGLTEEALNQYKALRQSDQKVITTATDGLVFLFKSKLPGLGLARRMGLVALDNSAVLKNLVLRHARGFGGVVPDLVCGIPLDVR